MGTSSDSRAASPRTAPQAETLIEAATSDTGPILHLHEIDRLGTLDIFRQIEIPPLVGQELSRFGLGPTRLAELGLPNVEVSPVDEPVWKKFLRESASRIQPADAQVAVLASKLGEKQPVLTDDLALRRVVEGRGGIVVGSVGILVRAYKAWKWEKSQLREAVDLLFSKSTLHISPAFRGYVQSLLKRL